MLDPKAIVYDIETVDTVRLFAFVLVHSSSCSTFPKSIVLERCKNENLRTDSIPFWWLGNLEADKLTVIWEIN